LWFSRVLTASKCGNKDQVDLEEFLLALEAEDQDSDDNIELDIERQALE
jgi:hypothetical protein